MSEISSGLVAVAWLAPSNYEWPSHFISLTEIRNGEPLVRLSDAEAIISAKDAEIAESDHIRDRCAHLLAETAVALKGPEKALHRHGWQDLPEVAAKQSAALKLARDALGKLSLYVAYNGDDWVKRNATDALAAIDALGE